jgi:glucans biosynthesis protein
MVLSRRSILAAWLGYGAVCFDTTTAQAAEGDDWPREAPLGPARPFSFERLKAQAVALAGRPYSPPPPPPAEVVHAIDYDAIGQIVYRPGAALWGGRPGGGSIRMFHIGRFASRPIEMNLVHDGQARRVLYAETLFDMPADSPARKLDGWGGFAGFRAMNADQTTDWVAYLGASYFRSADPFNQYGLSARGLAIDTATPKPEEFPAFTTFWLEHDPADQLVVYALLDGPSVTGAYRIAHRRSKAGLAQDIQVQLTFRAPIERLGLAPLTSMYWYGRSDRTPADDWRPQIHDSEGLAIWTGGGERIWRPLSDPPRVTTNLFLDKAPRGFGLMQRDRNFEDYQDDGVFYDRRPSAWVEPVGDWGEGSVQLVEIPTIDETADNIVAFWTPAAPVRAGQVMNYRYRLYWTDEEPQPIGVARVIATRMGKAGRPGQPPGSGRRKIVVDFAGATLDGLTRNSEVEAVVDVYPGRAGEVAAYPVVGADRWRLMFEIDAPAGAVDLRAFLRRGGDALSETWTHQVLAA